MWRTPFKGIRQPLLVQDDAEVKQLQSGRWTCRKRQHIEWSPLPDQIEILMRRAGGAGRQMRFDICRCSDGQSRLNADEGFHEWNRLIALLRGVLTRESEIEREREVVGKLPPSEGGPTLAEESAPIRQPL